MPQEAFPGSGVGRVPIFDQQQNHPVDAFLVLPHDFIKRSEGDGKCVVISAGALKVVVRLFPRRATCSCGY